MFKGETPKLKDPDIKEKISKYPPPPNIDKLVAKLTKVSEIKPPKVSNNPLIIALNAIAKIKRQTKDGVQGHTMKELHTIFSKIMKRPVGMQKVQSLNESTLNFADHRKHQGEEIAMRQVEKKHMKE